MGLILSFSGSTDGGGELERGRGNREMCQQDAQPPVYVGLGGEEGGMWAWEVRREGCGLGR